MTIEVKTYQGENVPDGVSLALKHRLYVSGWDLSKTLKTMRRKKEGVISLTFKEGIPVALSVSHRGTTQAFCRKAERRNGYASLAVKEIRNVTNDRNHGYGLYNVSDKFWNKVWK